MDNPNKMDIDFTTQPAKAGSARFQVADAAGAASSAPGRSGLALGHVQLELNLEEFVERPVELTLDAGELDIAQLGLALTVNGKQLEGCSATVQYRISVPARHFQVGANRVDLVQPPLVVQNIAVAIPHQQADDQQQNPDEGIPFGLTQPDYGHK